MDKLLYSLGINVDVDRLQDELKYILTLTQWHPLNNQISVQYRAGDDEDIWYSGGGKLGEWIDGKWCPFFDERDFNIINPALKGSYLDQVLNSMPVTAVRARLMRLKPKSCYSIHVDRTARYHIALHTNQHARFIFTKNNQVHQIPADGNVYFANTVLEHTAINGGQDDRIHLVFLAA
jgi:hypothetical protein